MNDTDFMTGSESVKFEAHIYRGKADTWGTPLVGQTFEDFVNAWATQRQGRPIPQEGISKPDATAPGGVVTVYGVDEKDGPMIGAPKADQGKGRGKNNARPSRWACVDFDNVPAAYIDALHRYAFPAFRCAVWRSHFWREEDQRTRALFALSSVPGNAESYAATVRAIVDGLNGIVQQHGVEPPALDDESCTTLAQAQYTVPTGRSVKMFGGPEFAPVDAAPVQESVAVREPPQYAGHSLPTIGGDRYAEAALRNQVQDLAGTMQGGRNAALNVSACKLFGYVAAGRLSESVVEAALLDACARNGLLREDGERACLATIKSGAARGKASPNYDHMPNERATRPAHAPEWGESAPWEEEPPEWLDNQDTEFYSAPPVEVAEGIAPTDAPQKPAQWEPVPVAQQVFGILGEIEKAPDPLPTGLAGFDALLKGGFPSFGLFVLGAAPATGKTALALQVAVNVARSGHAAMFVSCEMAQSELMIRTLCQLSDRDRLTQADIERSIRDKSVEDCAPWKAFCDTAPNLYIEEMDDPTIEDIAEKVRIFAERCHDRRPIVFVDYLQLIRARDPKRGEENRNRDTVTRLSYVSRELKKASKLCPVVVISSINREGYKGAPSMENLKNCGDIEFSADWAGILTQSDTLGDAATAAAIQADADEKELMLVTVKGRRWRNGAKAYFRYHGPSYQFADATPGATSKPSQTTGAKDWADMTDEERDQERASFRAACRR